MIRFNNEEIEIDTEKLIKKDSLSGSDAVNIVQEFKQCPKCTNKINPNVEDNIILDATETVVWDSRLNDSEFHTCSNCQATFCIAVKQDLTSREWGKLWGTGDRIWVKMSSKCVSIDNSDIAIKLVDN